LSADREENADVIAAWIERWRPPVTQAVAAFAPVFDEKSSRSPAVTFAAVLADVDTTCREYWASLNRSS